MRRTSSACVLLPLLAVAGCGGAHEPAPVDATSRCDGCDATASTDATAPDAPTTSDDATAADDAPSPTDAPATRDAAGPADAGSPDAGRALWVSAYYAGWMQDDVPPSVIDFASVSQIQHFALEPNDDGTLDADSNGVTDAHARAIVAAAHGAHRRVLITVGGADTVAHFRAAWSDAHRAAFVAALTAFVTRYGYDGLDVDVEPLGSGDAAAFQTFVRAVRASLDAAHPGAMLTAAAGDSPEAYTPIASLFDQINVMTYDTSGPWPGWVTWHNTPLHNGGMTFPSTGGPLPCVDTQVQAYTDAGLSRARLGIGIDFYGYDWRGATAPLQSIAGVTTTSDSYAALMDRYDAPAREHQDPAAMVPYLAVDNPGSADDHFVSYDDERSSAAKVDYARAQGLGDVIIWELGGGYRASQPAGSRDLLRRAVGHAAFGR